MRGVVSLEDKILPSAECSHSFYRRFLKSANKKKGAFNRFDVSILDSIFSFTVLRDGIEIKAVESYHNISILGSHVFC